MAPEVPAPGSFSYVKGGGAGDGAPRLQNGILKYARGLLKGEAAQVDAALQLDFQAILDGGAIYLPEFHCEAGDLATLQALARDLEQSADGLINWSQHLKHEDPDFSPAFQGVVRRMSEYFDVDVFATRLNFYRDGADWKPFHHGSHAFANGQKEDFTMGASFGAARDLAFLHEPSGQRFSFPQNNGDVFAFTSSVNRAFKHGVPKARRTNIGPRFSIIAWGRRRTINGRNGGRAGVVEDNAMAGHGGTRPFGGGRKVGGGGGHARPPHPSGLLDGGEREASRNERVLAGADVSDLVADLVLKEEGAGRAGAKTKTAGGGRGRAGAGKRPKPVRALRGRLGEDRFQELKALGRRFQRGHVGARELYETALGLLDGDADALMGLVDSLPGEQKRAEVGEWHRTRAEWA